MWRSDSLKNPDRQETVTGKEAIELEEADKTGDTTVDIESVPTQRMK